jgi:polar amino acid transport system substrate-binding protein
MIKLFIGACFFLTSIFADNIQPLTENVEPWQIKDTNGLSGIGVEIIQEIQKKINNKKKILVLPWNRIYNMALKKEGFAIFSTSRSKKREKLFKWVGPLYLNQLAVYKHIDNKKTYKTLDDARKAQFLAVTKNDISEQYLSSKNFDNLLVSFDKNNQLNIQKVLEKKAELIPSGEISTEYKIKKLGLENKIIKTKIPPFYKNELYIAFNINTSDEVITRWQKALDEIKADGTYNKILKKYK